MEDSYPRKLEVWPGWALSLRDGLASTNGRPAAAAPADLADRLYASEALNPAAASPRSPDGAEPYSLQWFLEVESQRHGRQGRWIPRLLEFAKHSGETLLGLGDGLGTDWVQYARHGAQVIVCASAAEQLALVRRNFELRGLTARFLSSHPACLPLEPSSIDVVCVSGLLAEVADPAAVIDQLYRVLKPGGKVLAVTPARYDVNYWSRVFLPWLRWLRPHPGGDVPRGVSKRGLHQLFVRFVEHRVYKRQLRRGDVPHLWRWMPLPLLERLMGRVLVLKAFKPLSAAMSVQLAA
jgi:SAM-dependent methyltransferase